jgi:hypothetical protein
MAAAAAAGRAHAAAPETIDRMTVGHWPFTTTLSGGGQIELTSFPRTYTLSNGSKWDSGAGSFGMATGTVLSESVVGSTVRYEMKASGTPPYLLNYTDFDSGDHSAAGRLEPWGPMTLVATVGSRTGTINGWALVASNTETYYGDKFNHFSAPVGSIVPFTLTYTLSSPATWQPGIFDGGFRYRTDGEFRFNEFQAVPEPVALPLVATAAGMMLVRRGRRVVG